MTQDADPRLIKAVRLADAERQGRIKAERQASALRAENLRLRRAIIRMRELAAAKPMEAPAHAC